MLASPTIAVLKPRRKSAIVIGLPAFNARAFSAWAHEHGEIVNVTPQRIDILAGEFAEYADSQARPVLKPVGRFDGADFTQWMRDVGLLSDISPKQLAEYVTWYCAVIGHCHTPAHTVGKLLRPYGWVRYRGTQRANVTTGKVQKPTYYRLETAK